MDDVTLAIIGTQVIVADENHLKVYRGTPYSHAPRGQWYIDPNPNARRRPGHLALRQRHSGCLAHILNENATKTLSGGPLS